MPERSNPRYGKIIEETSYSDGNIAAVKRSYVDSVSVDGVMQVIEVVGSTCKQEMGNTDNHVITFEVYADHKTLKPVRIVRKWQLERK